MRPGVTTTLKECAKSPAASGTFCHSDLFLSNITFLTPSHASIQLKVNAMTAITSLRQS